jgi:drug/metabolite transporter (DMT)-like permease
MSVQGALLVLFAALLSAGSNLLLRYGVRAGGGFGVSGAGLVRDLVRLCLQPGFLAGLFFYGAAALVWFRIMSTENLATSYVVLVSATFILVISGSVFFFGEPFTPRKAAGLLVVLAGIYLATTS